MNKYIKLVNIILIFVIILGLGITKSFAATSLQEGIEEGLIYDAASDDWNAGNIVKFLDKYGGFPKGLPEEVRTKWRNTLSSSSVDEQSGDIIYYEIGGEKLIASGSYVNGKKVDSVISKYLNKNVVVTDEQLVEAVNEILDRNLSFEDIIAGIEQDPSMSLEEKQEEINKATDALEGEIYQEKEDLSSGIVGTENKDRNIDSTISAAKNFITSANTSGTIDEGELQKGIANIYNIFFAIGMIAVVACGSALGIRFMVSSVEGKAEVKELLVPYLVGTFIVFGAFGIWKLVMEIAKLF